MADLRRADQYDDATLGVEKVLTLELGGKNPFIVFPDADIEHAAAAGANGMNLDWTLGQSCGSTSRAFVHVSLYGEFVDRVRQKFGSLHVGLPTDEATELGCLVSRGQLERVERYVAAGRTEGATLVTGGARPADERLSRGNFYLPTLFADVSPSMRIAREEIFGPVLSVIPWDDEDEMLTHVNGLEYGLTANVWTNDLRVAHRMAEEIESATYGSMATGATSPGRHSAASSPAASVPRSHWMSC